MTPKPRDNVARLDPYVPGEQPADATVVKLNTNENPYPPCDAVMRAIADTPAEALRRYPSPTASGFRVAAANFHGIEPTQIIATNGGDELLRMIITAYCDSHDAATSTQASGGIAVTDPTYSLYPILAAIHHTPVVVFERGDDFELPQELGRRAREAGCRVLFIVNPHAPTGRIETVETLREIAVAFDGLLVIDEAYTNFAEFDALPLVQEGSMQCDNVILLRSMSKGYSLAGLRFGYGMASSQIITTLDKIRDSYNLDILAQRAATAAIEHADEAATTWQAVKRDRAALAQELAHLGLSVMPSQSNFLLVTFPKGQAEPAYQYLANQQIFVRYFKHPRMTDKLRISVGTPDQNRTLVKSLAKFLNKPIT